MIFSTGTGSAPGLPPVDAAVVLIAPIDDGARGLRLVRPMIGLSFRPVGSDRAPAAATREALVEALAPAEHAAGEMSLGAADLL